MPTWIDSDERREGRIIRPVAVGFLADVGGILYLLKPEGFVAPRKTRLDKSGETTTVWDESALPIDLIVGCRVSVLEVTGTEEVRCNFDECQTCGATECAEHGGPGGAGELAPIVHHTLLWSTVRL